MDDNVYANFRSLNLAEDGVAWESFTVISIDFSLIYKNNYYQQVYCRQVNDGNLFGADEDFFFFDFDEGVLYKCCITIELI